MSDPVITLSDGTTTININKDLYWSDEHDWQPVAMAQERSITGAFIIDEANMIEGRPITLQPEDQKSGATLKATLDQLRNWAAVAGQELTLTLRTVAYKVKFRHWETPLVAVPWTHYDDTLSTDYYFCIMKFFVKEVL